jgi:hypothetical protein
MDASPSIHAAALTSPSVRRRLALNWRYTPMTCVYTSPR